MTFLYKPTASNPVKQRTGSVSGSITSRNTRKEIDLCKAYQANEQEAIGHRVDEMVGFRQQRNVDGDDVSVGQQLIHGDVLGVGDGGDPVVGWVSVIAEDLKNKQPRLLWDEPLISTTVGVADV